MNILRSLTLLVVAAGLLVGCDNSGSTLPTDERIVSFAESELTVSEDADGDSVLVELPLTAYNPSHGEFTAEIVFDAQASTASAEDVGGFTSTSFTFPASTIEGQEFTLPIYVMNDTDLEGPETAVFNILPGEGVAAADSITSFEVIIEDDDLMSVEEARDAGVGSTVGFMGTVTRAMGAFTYIQDGTAGIVIRQTSGDFNAAVADGTIAPGTQIMIQGELSAYRELLQINGDDLASYEIMGSNAVPEPEVVTLQEIEDNGNDYESMLVRVDDVEIFSDASTFEAGTNYTIEDPSGGIVDLRVANADDTELDGTNIPSGTVSIIAPIGQFSFDSPDAGFQLLPVQESDIVTGN